MTHPVREQRSASEPRSAMRRFRRCGASAVGKRTFMSTGRLSVAQFSPILRPSAVNCERYAGGGSVCQRAIYQGLACYTEYGQLLLPSAYSLYPISRPSSRIYKVLGGKVGGRLSYPQLYGPPMGKLTATAVRAAKHPSNSQRPIRIGDGDGLYLQVARGDTKSWLLRYTLSGKAREMGLGPVGEPPTGVPLAKARVLAGEARALLRDGRDPLVQREAARAARRGPKPRPVSEPFAQPQQPWWTASGPAGGAPNTPPNGWRRWRRMPSR